MQEPKEQGANVEKKNNSAMAQNPKNFLNQTDVLQKFKELYMSVHYATEAEAEAKVGKELMLFLNSIDEINENLVKRQKKPLYTSEGGMPTETKKSIYKSFMKLATSGYTMDEGHSYLVAYGNRVEWQKGANGKFEEILQMDDVESMNNDLIIVYDFEVQEGNFEFDISIPKITKHIRKRLPTREECNQISYVYWNIKLKNGETLCRVVDRLQIERAIEFNLTDEQIAKKDYGRSYRKAKPEMYRAKAINIIYKSMMKGKKKRVLDFEEEASIFGKNIINLDSSPQNWNKESNVDFETGEIFDDFD